MDIKIRSRRDFLKSAGLFAVSMLATSCTEGIGISKKTGKKPNIVIFLSDDHGWRDIGCYGNKIVRTPNIDKLATEGMKFNDVFTVTAICSPSRSAWYTGLYPHRNGCLSNNGKLINRIKAGIKTLPDYLKPLGYRVAIAGKTHIEPKTQFPFEHMGMILAEIQNFLKDVGDTPFCLFVTPPLPHGPVTGFTRGESYDPNTIPVWPYFVDTPELRQQFTHYYELITKTDGIFGKVMEFLDDFKLRNNTLLIYSTDHGPNFPFEKWTCYDDGLHVPFIARWPGVIKPNTQTDALISSVDVLPTLIDVAGGAAPKGLDGRSFLKVLQGKAKEHDDAVFGAFTGVGIKYEIRSVRTNEFRYIRNFNYNNKFKSVINMGKNLTWQSWLEKAKDDSFAARQVRFYENRPAEELYDVKKDPYELYNLANTPAYDKIKKQLGEKLQKWMKQQNDSEQYPKD